MEDNNNAYNVLYWYKCDREIDLVSFGLDSILK